MRRSPLGFDPAIYATAALHLLRNPTVIVVPLLCAVLAVFVTRFANAPGGGLLSAATGGITGFLIGLIQLWGFGVACCVAEPLWRRGRTSFDDAWNDARRRGGDILFAALGYTFVLSIALYAGQIISFLGLILAALAAYFFVYAIPAAAIGGVPGGAALQISIDRVQRAPLAAGVATAVGIFLFFFVAPWAGASIGLMLLPVTGDSTIVAALIGALVQAIITGYLALVLSKQYDDVS